MQAIISLLKQQRPSDSIRGSRFKFGSYGTPCPLLFKIIQIPNFAFTKVPELTVLGRPLKKDKQNRPPFDVTRPGYRTALIKRVCCKIRFSASKKFYEIYIRVNKALTPSRR